MSTVFAGESIQAAWDKAATSEKILLKAAGQHRPSAQLRLHNKTNVTLEGEPGHKLLLDLIPSAGALWWANAPGCRAVALDAWGAQRSNVYVNGAPGYVMADCRLGKCGKEWNLDHNVYIEDADDGELLGNVISDAFAWGIQLHSSSGANQSLRLKLLRNDIFGNGRGGNCGGIIVSRGVVGALIEGNLIHGNLTNAGVYGYADGTATLTKNWLWGNQGGAIYDDPGQPGKLTILPDNIFTAPATPPPPPPAPTPTPTPVPTPTPTPAPSPCLAEQTKLKAAADRCRAGLASELKGY